MAAPFVLDLLGFVGDKPNTADIANHGSTDIARGVLEVLGISHQAPNAQTAGMNLEEKEDMVRFLLELSESWGQTMILVEHDMSIVMSMYIQCKSRVNPCVICG